MAHFLSMTSPAELKFMEIMQDEFEMDLKHRAPVSVLGNKPNYKCPTCSKEMMIAGKINRDINEERAEGKNVVQRYTCHGCGKQVVPVKI